MPKNVGKVQISRKKHLLAPFGAIWGQLFHGPKTYNKQKTGIFATRVGVVCELTMDVILDD